MRTRISYNGNSYGNIGSAQKYVLEIGRSLPDQIRIKYTYDRPSLGLGVGDGAGSVTGGFLELPASAAEALARAMQLHASTPSVKPTVIEVNERTNPAMHDSSSQNHVAPSKGG